MLVTFGAGHPKFKSMTSAESSSMVAAVTMSSISPPKICGMNGCSLGSDSIFRHDAVASRLKCRTVRKFCDRNVRTTFFRKQAVREDQKHLPSERDRAAVVHPTMAHKCRSQVSSSCIARRHDLFNHRANSTYSPQQTIESCCHVYFGIFKRCTNQSIP